MPTQSVDAGDRAVAFLPPLSHPGACQPEPSFHNKSGGPSDPESDRIYR
ncbi:MAG: hypothetical protein ACD_62C00206G0003, partial [uncultured bacterium]